MMNEPMELSYGKCRELLAAGVFGRVGVCTPQKPVILPVNYSVVGEAIIFRTSPYGGGGQPRLGRADRLRGRLR